MDLQAIAGWVKTFSKEGVEFAYFAALLVGVWMSISALLKMASRGMDRGSDASLSMTAIIGRLLIGSCLVTMAQKMNSVLSTLGDGQSLRSVMSYTQNSVGIESNPVTQAMWAACTAFLVFFGTVMFMRGFLKFDKACQGSHDSGDLFWAGLWHVIGGALLVATFT